MKISFEGDVNRIVTEMKALLADLSVRGFEQDTPAPKPQGSEHANMMGLPSTAPVDKPVEKPVDKPVDKMAKARAARGKPKAAPAPASASAPAPEPEAAPEPFGEVDPAEIVKLRQKTLEDLQQAYANGHHKEVLELLSRFGNGAKSFRELPPDAFVPIREAIDLGALA